MKEHLEQKLLAAIYLNSGMIASEIFFEAITQGTEMWIEELLALPPEWGRVLAKDTLEGN